MAPDLAGLALHFNSLKPLFRHAPTGFPAFNNVRGVLLELRKQYGIFGEVDERLLRRVASEAADACRILCRHTYNLKQANKNASRPKVKELMSLCEQP